MKITADGVKQLARFGLVGCLNTFVDYAVFYLLISLGDLHKGFAQMAATGIAMCCSFFLNRRWTFQKNGHGTAGEIIRFIFTNIASMLTAILFTHLFYDILHAERAANAALSAMGLPYAFRGDSAVMLAKLLSSVFSVGVNFIGNKFWVFGNRNEGKEK